MANALRELGYSVHDFEEHLEYNLENYMDYIEGRRGEEVFYEMYREVDVVVDQPAATLFNLILQQFPDSKVILMVRSDSQAWLRSYTGTLDELYTKHIPMFYNVLPWLSKTHAALSEKKNEWNIQLTLHSIYAGNLNHFCMIQATGQDAFLKPFEETCPSLWKDQYTRYNAAVQVSWEMTNLQIRKCIIAGLGAAGSAACVQGRGWMGQPL